MHNNQSDIEQKQRQLAENVLSEPQTSNNPLPQQKNGNHIFLASVIGSIVGLFLGVSSCGIVWLITDFPEQSDSIAIIVAGCISPIIGGVFGIFTELVRQLDK